MAVRYLLGSDHIDKPGAELTKAKNEASGRMTKFVEANPELTQGPDIQEGLPYSSLACMTYMYKPVTGYKIRILSISGLRLLIDKMRGETVEQNRDKLKTMLDAWEQAQQGVSQCSSPVGNKRPRCTPAITMSEEQVENWQRLSQSTLEGIEDVKDTLSQQMQTGNDTIKQDMQEMKAQHEKDLAEMRAQHAQDLQALREEIRVTNEGRDKDREQYAQLEQALRAEMFAQRAQLVANDKVIESQRFTIARFNNSRDSVISEDREVNRSIRELIVSLRGVPAALEGMRVLLGVPAALEDMRTAMDILAATGFH